MDDILAPRNPMTMNSRHCPKCSLVLEEEMHTCSSCGMDLDETLAADDLDLPEIRLDFQPGEQLAGRYKIIERVGAGGMGVVYKAMDQTLGGMVALKLIQPELAARTASIERFRREVRITRQLTHRNVCRVHDIGESDGVLYLSMEWIEGETLHQLLTKTGVLKEGRALEIAKQIAAGLQAAHEARVIHRDLKPANVMIDSRGKVRILDFGLAVEQGVGQITRQGKVLGTVAYMSPEQQRGDPLDQRTDIYSLGLILRDMLLGMPAQSGARVSPVIQPVLDRLLALNRDDRYASAGEARDAFRDLLGDPTISSVSSVSQSGISDSRGARRRRAVALAAAGGLLLAALAIWTLLGRNPPTPSMKPEAQALYDRALEYLRDADDIADVDDAIQMLHRAENADPDAPLVLARLASSYWFRFGKTRSIASRQEAERYAAKAHLLDSELPELGYARAVGFHFEGKHEAAKQQLIPVVAARPGLAIAWAYLGTAYGHLDEYGKGVEALEEAMRLEPDSYRMLIFRGVFHQMFNEHGQAQRNFKRATEVRPESHIAWTNLGGALLFLGRFEEAADAFEQSIGIEDTPEARTNLGTAYYFMERFEDSVEHYEAATDLRSDVAVYWGNLGDAFLALNRLEDARGAYRHAAELAVKRVEAEPLSGDALKAAALYCAKARDEDCALENGARLTELRPGDAHAMLINAAVFCTLGRNEESLELLKQAINLGATRAQIQAVPEFSALADLPRFREILELAT